MGFLRKFFGDSSKKGSPSSTTRGIFLFVQCDRCGDKVRLFVHKEHELNQSDGGYVWHKTIIDNKCFQAITTVVNFDRNYRVISSEIDGGHYITQDEFEAQDKSSASESELGDA